MLTVRRWKGADTHTHTRVRAHTHTYIHIIECSPVGPVTKDQLEKTTRGADGRQFENEEGTTLLLLQSGQAWLSCPAELQCSTITCMCMHTHLYIDTHSTHVHKHVQVRTHAFTGTLA